MIGSLAHSGRVIFAAGAVMVAVFFTFALSGPLPPKEMGIILGIAVLLDAALIRLLLLPVLLRLMGSGRGTSHAGRTASSPTSPSDTPRRNTTMTMTASARSIDATLRQEIDVNGRHTIITDEPQSLGGSDTAPAPHELLPAMLASCISTMIGLYAQNHGWQLKGVRVDVEYDHDATPRRVDIAVHLPQGLTPDQVKRLRRVADSCPVRRALEAGFTFEEELVLDLPVS